MIYGLLNSPLFSWVLLGGNSLESPEFNFFKNKDLPGLFYYSCGVFSWCIFYSLKFIIGAGAFNVYSHFYFVLYAIELSKTNPFYGV